MSGVKGKSGRKAQPKSVKELKGTFRLDQHNEQQPVVAPLKRAPVCPSHLEGVARATWQRTAKVLIGMGVLTEADLHALEAYCVVYARWQAAEKELADAGSLVVWGGIGGLTRVASPYVKITEDCLKQLRAWMNEFGITPSSRSRVRVEKKAPVADPEDWFGNLHRN